MNRYLILFHHYFGSNEGVMTVVIKAANEERAREYLDAQFTHPQNWRLQSIQLIGVDAHA